MRSTRPTLPARVAFAPVSLVATLLCCPVASAAPLRVGPGEAYATPCQAIAAAAPNDEVLVKPGKYTDSCAISVAGLTVRGVDGRPTIDLSDTDHPAQYKGIYVVTADAVTIENLELTGAHISAANGENAAAIRLEGKNLTVRNCYLHGNQNGILGGSAGTLTVEYSEFAGNGVGNGCNGGGCTHNLYIGKIDTLYFRHNWSHAIADDTADKGHLLKSRAAANYIEYNRITGEDGTDSYEIDLPSGGFAVLLGNVIQKGKASGNGTLFSWGEEGIEHADKRVFVVNNTFVNDRPSGTFIHADGAVLSARNNLFAGPGTLTSVGTLSADNLGGVDPLFRDRANYDFRLQDTSPAIGKAMPPGSADTYSLVAKYEYVHPRSRVVRAQVHDVGALEHDTMAGPTAPDDAGIAVDAALPDPAGGDGDHAGDGDGAGEPGARDAGNGGGDPDAVSPSKKGSGGCALAIPTGQGGYAVFMGLGLLCFAARRRPRRKPGQPRASR